MLLFRHNENERSCVEKLPDTKYYISYVLPASLNPEYDEWKERHWKYARHIDRYSHQEKQYFIVPLPVVHGSQFYC